MCDWRPMSRQLEGHCRLARLTLPNSASGPSKAATGAARQTPAASPRPADSGVGPTPSQADSTEGQRAEDERMQRLGTHQQTAHCENLAKLAKPCETKTLFAKPCETCICESLRKLIFAKPCESCETNVKLRNKHLRNLAKLVFAKLAKHDLRNLAKHCETLIAKIAKVAKIELHCETISQITKHCK